MALPRHAALDENPGFLMRKVSEASFHGFAAITAARGLHPMHFGLLTIIDCEGPVSQNELSRHTGIDPSSMVARIDVLESLGLVERTRSESDRRSYELRLTPAGSTMVAELRREAKEYADRFMRVLSEPERRRFTALLRKLADAVDAEAAS